VLYDTTEGLVSSVSVVPRNVRPEHREPILTTSTPRYPVSHPLDIDGSFLGAKWRRSVTPAILHLVPNSITRGLINLHSKSMQGDEIIYSDYATSPLLQIIMGWRSSRKNDGTRLL